MYQFGGKDSKRHFTVVMGGKEHGLYVSSTPSSAAKKAVTKLCSANKSKKVEFEIREITQGSKKKTYGPYKGYLEKLKEPIKLKGRVIKYKPVAKLQEKNIKMKGGLFGLFDKVKESNSTNEGIQKMVENFKVEDQNNPAPYHYKKRHMNPSTLYFGKKQYLLEINQQKYYPYSFTIEDKTPIFRILTKSDIELSNGFSIFQDYLTKLEINDHYILVIKDLIKFIRFIANFCDDKSNLYKFTKNGFNSLDYSEYEKYKKQINIYIKFYNMIKNLLERFFDFRSREIFTEIIYKDSEGKNQKLPFYFQLLEDLLKSMQSFKLKDIFSKFSNSYTKENYDKKQDKKERLKLYNEIKSKFGPQLENIFFEQLKEGEFFEQLKKEEFEIDNKNKEKLRLSKEDSQEIIDEIYNMIFNENLDISQITNDQIKIKIIEYIKYKIKKIIELIKIHRKRQEEDRKRQEEDDKFRKILTSIENVYGNESQRKFDYYNPYRRYSYDYIKDQYKILKKQNPESDDIELIKKIFKESKKEINNLNKEQERNNQLIKEKQEQREREQEQRERDEEIKQERDSYHGPTGY